MAFALTLLIAGVLALGMVIVTTPSPVGTVGWERGSDLPRARGEVAGAPTVAPSGAPGLLVAGGFAAPTRTIAEVAIFDPTDDTWHPAPELPEPRHHAAATTLDDGTVILAGGAASALELDWTPRTEVWLLPPGAEEWEPGPALPEARWGHAMVTLEGFVYVVGGEGESDETLRLDPVEEVWRSLAPLPVGRDHLNAVVVEGEIWALGGRNETDGVLRRVDVYDPAADEWDDGEWLPRATSAAGVGVVGDTVVVTAGENPALRGGGITDEHWQLDINEGRWRRLATPPLAVHGAASGVVDGQLIIAGGAAQHGMLSPLAWEAATQLLEAEALR